MPQHTRHGIILYLGLLGGLALGGACRGPTESSDPASEFPVGFIFSADGVDARFAVATTPPTVQVLPGRVVVWGVIVTGTNCYRATGTLQQVADSTSLSLEIVSAVPPGTNAGCATRLAGERYRATVDAAPGPHRLRVRHPNGVVLDTLLAIPVR